MKINIFFFYLIDWSARNSSDQGANLTPKEEF